jgi:hypothetical protein
MLTTNLCDSIVPNEIIHIRVKLTELTGGGKGKFTMIDEYLNIPTSILSKASLESMTNGTFALVLVHESGVQYSN